MTKRVRQDVHSGALSAGGTGSLRSVSFVFLTALAAACDAGPSEADFMTACLTEGEKGVNKALRREMGVKSNAFCKCAATEARNALSTDARRAMILDMQGKKSQASAISSKMSDAEQLAFLKGGMAVFAKCTEAAQ